MKRWLVPAVALLAVGLTGVGVGWSINEWEDGEEASPVSPTTATASGPTEEELDAQRCEAALQALGNSTAPIAIVEARDAVQKYCR